VIERDIGDFVQYREIWGLRGIFKDWRISRN